MKTIRFFLNDIWAALMMFTRLPWWRLHQPQEEHFRNVTTVWPLTGWLTGGVMTLVFYAGIMFLPLPIAILLTILSRILLTGALHEDGLADFLDGMGGGKDKESILSIMKDSHIGTYGVLGLIIYLAFFFFGLQELTSKFLRESLTPESTCRNPLLMICMAMLFMDVWAKNLASMIVFQLPYARKEEEAKTHLVYKKNWGKQLLVCLLSLLPFIIIWSLTGCLPINNCLIIFVPIVVQTLLVWWMRERIGGYTGDCCGALFLLTEASTLFAWIIMIKG